MIPCAVGVRPCVRLRILTMKVAELMKMLLTLHVEKYSFMKPRLYYIILAVLTGWSVISCNSDDSEVTVIESTTLSNGEVKYFGLGSAPR